MGKLKKIGLMLSAFSSLAFSFLIHIDVRVDDIFELNDLGIPIQNLGEDIPLISERIRIEDPMENVALVYQTGSFNQAEIGQSGTRNLAIIYQEGLSNFASQTQGGNDNLALIAQRGDGNQAFQEQLSNGNRAVIIQVGYSNYAYQYQGGAGNWRSLVIQEGIGHRAIVYQP
jgi:minor curlin subunit